MCLTHSESGKPCGIEPCEQYNDMAGKLAIANGLCEKAARENDALREECSGLDAVNRNCNREIEQLRQELAAKDGHDRTNCPNCSNCIRDLREENARLVADLQKHKERRDHFEDLLNRSIEHEQEWIQRALKAEEEVKTLKRQLKVLGSACDKIQIQSKYHRRKTHVVQKATAWWRSRARKLQNERDALVQVSAEVCPDCGWAMKFPDEKCRNCEVIALRNVVKKTDALVNQMLPECEACGTPCQSYALARMYQEARHAG